MIDWLLAPLSGAASHELSAGLAWHGRCMVLAWGILVPVCILIARYWKIWPGQRWPQELDHKGWWHSHRAGQMFAIVLMTFGAGLAWTAGSSGTGTMTQFFASQAGKLHAILGWLLVVLGWLQVMGGWFRGSKGGPTGDTIRGDHYDMTHRRRIFEWTHKFLGWLALLLACATIVLGLIIADSPRWMLLALLGWWALLFAMAWRWQLQARCIDTYQAIWGTDPNLPGLRSRPIGFGVRRVKSLQAPNPAKRLNKSLYT